MANSSAFSGSFVGFALSGANTQAASNPYSVGFQSGGAGNYAQSSGTFVLTGLTPGATTVTMLFRRETGGTSTFTNRTLSAFSL